MTAKKTSVDIALNLTVQELGAVLIAMCSITVSDHREAYEKLRVRLTKALHTAAPELYGWLLQAGQIEAIKPARTRAAGQGPD